MKRLLFGMTLAMALSTTCMAANQGRITGIHFAGANYTSHPDVVQMTLDGGFNGDTCNTGLAAIRASDKHLVAFALAAHAAGMTVNVVLNPSDRYFDDRCVIVYIYAQE